MTQDPCRITLWQAPELGAELLSGRFTDFSYDVHTHETACFALLTAGAIRIRMRGTEFVARAGDLYAIGADEAHAGWPVDGDGWTLRTMYVDLQHLRGLFEDEGVARSSALSQAIAGPIIRDRPLAAALHRVHHSSEAGGPALARDEGYLSFAQRLFERHMRQAFLPEAGSAEPQAVGRARHFLDERLDRRVSLADIARAAGLPPYRLFRAFERQLGMTPHAYQRQARVRAAMRLIKARQPLSEVAAATGFADQAHLTRSFRRIMGLTPGCYRQAVTG